MQSESVYNEPIILWENAICQARREICAPKVMYRFQPIVGIISSLYLTKALFFITSLLAADNFDVSAKKNQELDGWTLKDTGFMFQL